MDKNGRTEKKEELSSSLREIFDDSAPGEDIQTIPSTPPKSSYRIRRRFYFTLGIIGTVLSAVGLVSVIGYAGRTISDIVNNTKQKNEFAEYIYPLVLCDPAPFEDRSGLRSETVITAAIWDIIINEDTAKYAAEFDYMTVPEADVEEHAAVLFGNGLSFGHKSVISADLQFYYDSTIKSYRVPSNPKYFSYSPVVEDIIADSGTYTLNVGYLSPAPAWSDKEQKPEKYVEYVLSKTADGYSISAVRMTDRVVSDNGL